MIEIKFTIVEVENLIRMHEFCQRWWNHEYARNAVAKLQGARREYFERFGEQKDLFQEGVNNEQRRA